jgi:glucosamine kinase
MATPVVIGVDNGGTWIRMIGLDASGKRVWNFKSPSPSVDKLPLYLRKHLRPFHGRLEGLAVGSRGVWKQSKCKDVKRALKGLAKRIVVMSDVEAAWLAAFGPKGNGIVVIAGTGSIAYGRKPDGTFARAGGFGPDKGDEGSGYWIGKEWLRRKTSSRRKPGTRKADWAPTSVGVTSKTVREISSLAPKVLSRAKRKHPIAIGIVRDAQQELSTLVFDLARKLPWKRTIPVSVSGSILDNVWFQKGFYRAISSHRFQKQAHQTDAATGLARSIISHADG